MLKNLIYSKSMEVITDKDFLLDDSIGFYIYLPNVTEQLIR
jgi:hypothetical protein